MRPCASVALGSESLRFGTAIAVPGSVTGAIWVTDREPGMRVLLGEQLPEADVLEPAELDRRLAAGLLPDALVIDGTQFLALSGRRRRDLTSLPRLLICTGIFLASLPIDLVGGPGIVILAKPFCVEDMEAAVEWLRGGVTTAESGGAVPAAVGQHRPARPALRRPTPGS